MLVAASAPQHALEVVEVPPVTLTVSRPLIHHLLDPLEQVRVHDRFGPTDVLLALVGDDAPVVRVTQPARSRRLQTPTTPSFVKSRQRADASTRDCHAWSMNWPSLTAAALPVLAALLTLALSQRHARRMAAEDRRERASEARVDRTFRARQERFADRRDAAAAFLKEVQHEVDRIAQFGRDPSYGGASPGDIYDDYEFTELNAVHAQLELISDDETAAISTDLRGAVVELFNGREGAWEKYLEARTAYLTAARTMLVADTSQDA